MNPDIDLKDVLAELQALMGQIRANVTDLNAILTEPEASDDHAPA